MDDAKRVRIDLSKYGRRPGTREEGAVAREEIAASLASLPSDGQLVVSLDGLDILSGTFAGEAIVKPYLGLVSGAYEDRTMITDAPSRELTEDLSRVLASENAAMLVLIDEAWDVLGAIGPHLRETLEAIVACQNTTVRELAGLLGISPHAAHDRVKRIIDQRLARWVETGQVAPKTQRNVVSIIGP